MSKLKVSIGRKQKNGMFNIVCLDTSTNEKKAKSLRVKEYNLAKGYLENVRQLINTNTIYNIDSFLNVVESIIPENDNTKPIDMEKVKLSSNFVKHTSLGFQNKFIVRRDDMNDAISEFKDIDHEMKENGLDVATLTCKKVKDIDGNEVITEINATYKIARYRYTDNTPKLIPTNSIKTGELRKYLAIMDIHVPYHNMKLLLSVIKMAIDNGFYGIIVNGDLMDLEYLSNYVKNQAIMGLPYIKKTIQEAGDIMKMITESPFQERVFIEGNHDERISRDVFGAGVSGIGISAYGEETDYFSVASLLRVDPSKWILKRYRERHKIGDLYVHHGEEFSKSKNIDRIRENELMGHVHRPETVYGYKINDKGVKETLISVRTGCMIDLKSNIPCMNKTMLDTWNNGFAVLNVINGKTYVDNILVYNDSYFYNNTLYTI